MDTIYHLIAGAIISAFIILMYGKRDSFNHRPDGVMVVAGLLPMVVGTGKEFFDLWIRHTNFDFADVTATWMGGLLAFFAILIYDVINKK